LETRIGAIGK